MQHIKKTTKIKTDNFYSTNKYLSKHPSLHVEDTPWKFAQIKPFLGKFMKKYSEIYDSRKLTVLDVGGGAGLILKKTAQEIEKNYGIKVEKIALDLSPLALEIQKKTNPDLKKTLNESICDTSLHPKEIDLTLMIDLLEHVPNPSLALREVKRISKFVIVKVPLEDNLLYDVWNVITGGKFRRKMLETWGHINIYKFNKLKHQIEMHAGKILSFGYTNVFQYAFAKARNKRRKALISIASYFYRISPTLCSIIFNDFVIILIKCY